MALGRTASAPMPASSNELEPLARALASVGRRFYARGWMDGTSGNLSAVLSRRPFRLAITASAVHKGTLRPNQILEINETGDVVGSKAMRSSAEAALHVEFVSRQGAAA